MGVLEEAFQRFSSRDYANAERLVRQALQQQPNHPDAWRLLGSIASAARQYDQAFAMLQRAISLAPDSAANYNALGIAHAEIDNAHEAKAAFAKALELSPRYAGAANNLAEAYIKLGNLKEALEQYRHAVEFDPTIPQFHNHLLYTMQFDPTLTQEDLLAEHRRFGQREAFKPRKRLSPFPNTPDPDRPIRIGYVSPDLCYHPTVRFFLHIWQQHNQEKYPFYLYGEVRRPDEVTKELADLSSGYRHTLGHSKEQVAQWIEEDQIDILVDLGGHTISNRLDVFPLRPAPVQATYPIYPYTTGLEAVDYRFSDNMLDPPDEVPPQSVEEIYRLDGCYACFSPLPGMPAPGPLPKDLAGKLTFGAPHQLVKYNKPMLETWAAILKQLPDAELLIFRSTLSDNAQQILRERLQDAGISLNQVRLKRPGPRADYLGYAQQVDLLLDAHPFSGCTTACEYLWMGVPLVSRYGNRPASRVAGSLLKTLGLEDLVAYSDEEYIEKNVALAKNDARMRELRSTLRDRFQQTLGDGATFTRKLEAAYRDIWQRWCRQQTGSPQPEPPKVSEPIPPVAPTTLDLPSSPDSIPPLTIEKPTASTPRSQAISNMPTVATKKDQAKSEGKGVLFFQDFQADPPSTSPAPPSALAKVPEFTTSSDIPQIVPENLQETTKENEYVPLSQSSLWDYQEDVYRRSGTEAWSGERAIPHYISTNAVLAHHYSLLIDSFYNEYRSKKKKGRAGPINLIEMGAGTGRLAFHLLRELETLSSYLPHHSAGYRYLLTDIGETPSFWKKNKQLQFDLEKVKSDFAEFDALEHTELKLTRSKETVSLTNQKAPFVFMANYVFDSLPADWWRVEGSTLYQGKFSGFPPRQQSPGSQQPTESWECHFEPLPEGEPAYRDDPTLSKVLESYRRELNGASFLVPIGGIQVIRRLKEQNEGPLLFLLGDKGHAQPELWEQPRQLPPIAWHGDTISMTVNFDLLARYFKEAGGSYFIPADHESVFAATMGLLNATESDYPQLAKCYRQVIDQEPVTCQLPFFSQSLPNDPTIEYLLSMWTIVRHDPQLILQHPIDNWVPSIQKANPDQKLRLLAHVEKIEDRVYATNPRELQIYPRLAQLCFSAGAPQKAIDYLKKGIELGVPDPGSSWHNLALCYQQIGQTQEAEHARQQAQQLGTT
ncbi:Hypothetical protein PBC10988_5480 [Planctomycetales bacterium 10988]|nr:Hypothetical protein PBC10988_5480 [Planctomycetales bacterium 10988]